jgi:pyrroloquinoline quinone biosynthesis protein B
MSAQPRTQSSIAVRGREGPWFLVNASPDLGRQVAALATARGGAEAGAREARPGRPASAARGRPAAAAIGAKQAAGRTRIEPIAGVLLTDAEIDHTAGLLLLRESSAPVRVYGAPEVEMALRGAYPVLSVLECYCGVEWQTLSVGKVHELEGSSLTVERFDVGGDSPRYLAGSGIEMGASGLMLRDRASGAVATYAPGLARLDEEVITRLADSDAVLIDGTFWSDDELVRLGVSERTAREMGHVPLSGPGGTLAALAPLARPRKVLLHINNTNPILLENSPEREAVLQAGVEIASDGLELRL